ncbi:MAG: hypothetical protein KDA24_10830 [Deltaproteobacteria bacterium]|nr:hypothetical protein [Deltaproteobacteria bacterium]
MPAQPPDRIQSVLETVLPSQVPRRDGEDLSAWLTEASASVATLRARAPAPDRLGGLLVEHLLALAEGPVSQGLLRSPGRAVLLGELARNLADPGRINQGRKQTCAPTCVETYLGITDPGEYARVAVGLCSPDGTVTLADGNFILQRDGDAPLLWEEVEGDRSPISRLIQVAAMEAASADHDYDNAADAQLDGAGLSAGSGMDLAAFDTLIEAVTGVAWERWRRVEHGFLEMLHGQGVGAKPLGLDDLLGATEASLAGGDFAFATLVPAGVDPRRLARAMGGFDPRASLDEIEAVDGPVHMKGHKVRIVGLDREAGTVRFDDPLDPDVSWMGLGATLEDASGVCAMPLQTFLECAADFSLRSDFWPTPAS